MNLKNSSVWYSEPWVWFNVIIFICACTTALLMTFIAIRYSPAEMSAQWYQDGPLIKQQKNNSMSIDSADLVARMQIAGRHIKLNLFSAKNGQVNLSGYPGLRVYIEHPHQPERDQVVILRPLSKGHYDGDLTTELSGKRYFMISPESNEWSMVATAVFPRDHNIDFLIHSREGVINE